MDLPERLRGGGADDDDDQEEDLSKATEEWPETYVQQSVYGIIAAARGRGKLLPSLRRDSGSDSDSEADSNKTRQSAGSSRRGSTQLGPRSSVDRARPPSGGTDVDRQSKGRVTALRPTRDRRRSSDEDIMTQSQFLPPREQPQDSVGIDAPPSSGAVPTPADRPSDLESRSVLLSRALADIFNFDALEEVISDHQCWYLQNVLLQGHLYITQKHVCFYAYLPKKGHTVKSGHLSKQGRHSLRYRRSWFVLKGDVLSYYSSATDLYFPRGSIDLRFAIAADLCLEKSHDDTDTTVFTIVTNERTHCFRADSAASAKEWVRQLQRIIFRSHHDGDSVKVCLPTEAIVDVEPNPVLEVAETVKIRVIDSEQTYAVDEYFFTFFGEGKDVLSKLARLAEKNGSRARQRSLGSTLNATAPSQSHLAPDSPSSESTPRPELATFRSRLDAFEHSTASEATVSPIIGSPLPSIATEGGSVDSPVTSETEIASPVAPAAQEVDMSASQILVGDEAFRSPTLRASASRHLEPQLGPIAPDAASRRSEDESSDAETGTLHLSQTLRRDQPSSGLEHTGPGAEQRLGLDSAMSTRPTRAVATPLQQAYALAGVVRSQSKRMGSILSSSPKNYYDKFSGALAGGKRHYTDAGGIGMEDCVEDPELDMEGAEHERRFQQHFGLESAEKLRAVYYCSLHRVLPLYGKVYISDRHFCFRSLIYGTRTKLVVPFAEIDNISKEKGFRWGYPGMVLIIRGHEELFFDFGSADARDDCVITVLRTLDVMKVSMSSTVQTQDEGLGIAAAAAENEALLDARKLPTDPDLAVLRDLGERLGDNPSVVFDDASASLLDFRPKISLRITCLTIGSRGDVQPYIALCKGLIKEGHQARIATHAQFGDWIRKHGIEFAPVAGDPAVLMRMCVENGMFTPSFLYEANSKFRSWLDGLLDSSWAACANSDLLIESPSAMAGIHIAEAMGIPYFRAFTMPWTKTRAYPHAFATHGKRMGGQYNYTSYTIFDYVFWQLTAAQINRWRRKTLGLKPTDHIKMQSNKVPFLYNFSPSVVPPPLDFSDWIRITGYWFLDEGEGWTPPEDLVAFIDKARADGMKLVYIGFGSVPVADSRGLTQQIVDAVLKADVRCILSKGWSDHFDQQQQKGGTSAPAEPALPASIFPIRAAPHDWLFARIDAAVHHGGAGTTGASLRAGLPTVVKPFFGDQFFFATRVDDLGVGIHLRRISVNALGRAIWRAAHDDRMRTKARLLGDSIRREDGVQAAITAIYRDLEYARTLVKKRDGVPVPSVGAAGDERPAAHGGGGGGGGGGVDEDDEDEESWTFVENESDVDVTGARRGGGLGIGLPLRAQQLLAKRAAFGPMALRARRD